MTPTDLDLNTLDPQQIRAMMRGGRDELRLRGLLGKISLRTGDGSLTKEEVKQIVYYASGVGEKPVDIADRIIQLRRSPEIVQLTDSKGNQATLARILGVRPCGHQKRYWGENNVLILLGTGTLVEIKTKASSEVARGEFLLLPVEAGTVPERQYGELFVQAWQQLQFRPCPQAWAVVLKHAALSDTPQEAMLSWCLHRLRLALSWQVQQTDGVIPALMSPAVFRHPLRSWIFHRHASNLVSSLWQTNLLASVEAYLRLQNLLRSDLRHHPAFQVPLLTIHKWGMKQLKQASVRAEHLRAAVSQSLGFVLKGSRNEQQWVRSANGESVVITHTLGIVINKQSRCVVEATQALLPPADQVVRRMLTLGTTHRNQISTLKDDLPVLERLFQDVNEAELWPLIEQYEVQKGDTPHETGTNHHN